MSAITREIIFSDKDKNHHVSVVGKKINVSINGCCEDEIDAQDAELLINLLQEAINEIAGAAQ